MSLGLSRQRKQDFDPFACKLTRFVLYFLPYSFYLVFPYNFCAEGSKYHCLAFGFVCSTTASMDIPFPCKLSRFPLYLLSSPTLLASTRVLAFSHALNCH